MNHPDEETERFIKRWLAEYRRLTFFEKPGADRRRTLYEKIEADRRRRLEDPDLSGAALADLYNEAAAHQARMEARAKGAKLRDAQRVGREARAAKHKKRGDRIGKMALDFARDYRKRRPSATPREVLSHVRRRLAKKLRRGERQIRNLVTESDIDD